MIKRTLIAVFLAFTMLGLLLAWLLAPTSVKGESAMSAPQSAPPTGGPDESSPVMSPVNTSPNAALDYWTPERMKSAIPMPWPRVDAVPGNPSQPSSQKPVGTTGPAMAVDGNAPK